MDHYRALSRWSVASMLSLGVAISFAVAWADQRQAILVRNAVDDLFRLAAQDKSLLGNPNATIRFSGHSNFQLYMQRHGAVPIEDRVPSLPAGDLVIFPENVYGVMPGHVGFSPLNRIQYPSTGWLTTSNAQLGVNFYCSYGYDLPFAFAPVPPEAFDIELATPGSRIYSADRVR